MNGITSLIILIFSAIVHEVSHGIVAEKLGDSTARDEGRITLNPIPHIDPFGSILLPLLTGISTNWNLVLGSAKPVPVNYSNLRNPKLGLVLVGLAGPMANFCLAILFTIVIKLGVINHISGPILFQAIIINLVLAVFNILPIPPLDGSKILSGLLPHKYADVILSWEKYGFIIIILFLLLGLLDYILWPVILIFFNIFNLPLGL